MLHCKDAGQAKEHSALAAMLNYVLALPDLVGLPVGQASAARAPHGQAHRTLDSSEDENLSEDSSQADEGECFNVEAFLDVRK